MQGIGVPVKLVTFLSGITSTIYRTISYSGIQILIFLTAIQSVPKHLYEAATIEGATGYEQFLENYITNGFTNDFNSCGIYNCGFIFEIRNWRCNG